MTKQRPNITGKIFLLFCLLFAFKAPAIHQQVCTFESGSPLAGGSDTTKVGYYYHEDNLNSSSALSSYIRTHEPTKARGMP